MESVEKSKEEALPKWRDSITYDKELNDEERVMMAEVCGTAPYLLSIRVLPLKSMKNRGDVVTIYETTTGDIIQGQIDEEMLEI